MKTILTAAAAVLLVASAAQAADLAPKPYYKAPPAPVAPALTWNGLYLGVHGGYAWGTGRGSVLGLTGSADVSGGFGGGQIGYNFQTGPMVLGVEADISGGDIGGSDTFAGVNASSSIDIMNTVRGRLGMAWGPTLLYATGGAAWAHNKVDIDTGLASFSSTRGHTGWTVGGGLEYMMTPGWSAKIEYLYADFGSRNYFGGVVPGGVDLSAKVHSVRVGLNYHFNSGSPIFGAF